MSLVYRRVDIILSSNADGEAHEGDSLMIETDSAPVRGELVLVRDGGVESICRWKGDPSGNLVGLIVGIRRRP